VSLCGTDLPDAEEVYPKFPLLLCVGVKAGFADIAGFVDVATGGGASPAEYLEPEESATFFMMPSGVRSLSERAVIWT
jgi:hypothetical protein